MYLESQTETTSNATMYPRRSELARKIKETSVEAPLNEKLLLLDYFQQGTFFQESGIVLWDGSMIPQILQDAYWFPETTKVVAYVPPHLCNLYSYALGFVPSDITERNEKIRIDGLLWDGQDISLDEGLVLWAQ